MFHFYTPSKTSENLTHFQPMFHFYNPWKQKTAGFFYVFRGYRSGTLVENGLILRQKMKELISLSGRIVLIERT